MAGGMLDVSALLRQRPPSPSSLAEQVLHLRDRNLLLKNVVQSLRLQLRQQQEDIRQAQAEVVAASQRPARRR